MATGLVATTNPHGPGRWQKSYATEFRGRRVAVIPDNDAPGIEHANKVAKSLAGVARSVRIITLPGVGEGGDVSDWMDQGHIAYELSEILAQTPPFEPPAPEDRTTDNADSPKWKQSSLLPHARRITEDMKVRGFFVNGDDEYYYFDRQQHQLVWIEKDDPDLQVVLAEHYQINRIDPALRLSLPPPAGRIPGPGHPVAGPPVFLLRQEGQHRLPGHGCRAGAENQCRHHRSPRQWRRCPIVHARPGPLPLGVSGSNKERPPL